MTQRVLPALLGALSALALLYVYAPNPSTVSLIESGPVSSKNPFVEVAKKVRPSTTQVIAYSLEARGEEGNGDDGGIIGAFRKYLGGFSRKAYKADSTGSGVVLDGRGHIVTSYHVIAGADMVAVRMFGAETETQAKVVGYDKMSDIALLKAPQSPAMVPATLGDSSTLAPGQLVAAIGGLYELEGSVTVGVISALSRSGLGLLDIEDFIQTDAAMGPGLSGGPLCDAKGRVIGVNTAIFGGGQGVGFAIPSSEVAKVVAELLKNGVVERGKIGVNLQALTSSLSEALHAGEGVKGAVVVETEPGSPARDAGIEPGDIITEFNGKPVDGPRELRKMVLKSQAGDSAKLALLRDGKRMTVKVKIKPMKG